MKIRILKASVPVKEYKLQRRILGIWIDCTSSGALSFLSMDGGARRFYHFDDVKAAKDQLERFTQKPVKPNWQVIE